MPAVPTEVPAQVEQAEVTPEAQQPGQAGIVPETPAAQAAQADAPEPSFSEAFNNDELMQAAARGAQPAQDDDAEAKAPEAAAPELSEQAPNAEVKDTPAEGAQVEEGAKAQGRDDVPFEEAFNNAFNPVPEQSAKPSQTQPSEPGQAEAVKPEAPIWSLTPAEYAKQKDVTEADIIEAHRAAVEQAILDGKRVPAEVIAAYEQPQAEQPAEQPQAEQPAEQPQAEDENAPADEARPADVRDAEVVAESDENAGADVQPGVDDQREDSPQPGNERDPLAEGNERFGEQAEPAGVEDAEGGNVIRTTTTTPGGVSISIGDREADNVVNNTTNIVNNAAPEEKAPEQKAPANKDYLDVIDAALNPKREEAEVEAADNAVKAESPAMVEPAPVDIKPVSTPDAIAGVKVADMSADALERIANSDAPAANKARAELDRRAEAGVPLDKIMVKRPVYARDGKPVMKDGIQLMADEQADVALAEVDSQIDLIKRLLDCLNT
jgi:hypothetical protein